MRGATENRLVEQIQELRSRTNFQDALESDQWPETEVPVNEHWLAQGKDLPGTLRHLPGTLRQPVTRLAHRCPH
jgi:hypothetical protein